MTRLTLLAAGVLAVASATAYAQAQNTSPAPMHAHRQMHRQVAEPKHNAMHQQMHAQMHEHMQKKMQGKAASPPPAAGGHDGHGAAGSPPAAAGGGHDAHGASGSPQGDRGPSSLAFFGINQKMHEDMNIAYSGDADADFVNGMIPHHQGAVQMAKVVLAFGNDPEIRKLAEAIIQAQESEIAMMRAWLKRRTQ